MSILFPGITCMSAQHLVWVSISLALLFRYAYLLDTLESVNEIPQLSVDSKNVANLLVVSYWFVGVFQSSKSSEYMLHWRSRNEHRLLVLLIDIVNNILCTSIYFKNTLQLHQMDVFCSEEFWQLDCQLVLWYLFCFVQTWNSHNMRKFKRFPIEEDVEKLFSLAFAQ